MGDLEGLEEIAQQRSIRVNHLSRRVGFGWSVSPNIERAAVKRENEKPTKPVATSLPPPPPPAASAPSMMTEPVTGYTELIGVIRAQIGAMGVKYADFDAIARCDRPKQREQGGVVSVPHRIARVPVHLRQVARCGAPPQDREGRTFVA